MENVKRYQIVRFFRDDGKPAEIIEKGLTLEQAQAHCAREDTHGNDWFDGYTSEHWIDNRKTEVADDA